MERWSRIVLANFFGISLAVLPGFCDETAQVIMVVTLVMVTETGLLFGLPGYKSGVLLMLAGIFGVMVLGGASVMWENQELNLGVALLVLGFVILNYQAFTWETIPTVQVPPSMQEECERESMEELAMASVVIGLMGAAGIGIVALSSWPLTTLNMEDLAFIAIFGYMAFAGLTVLTLSRMRLRLKS